MTRRSMLFALSGFVVGALAHPLEVQARTIAVPAGKSIHAALKTLRAGDVVFVEGDHQESISIPSGITLKGRRRSIIWSETGPAITVDSAQRVHLEGLRIETRARSAEGLAALRVVDSEVQIRGNRFRSTRNGVIIKGHSRALFVGNTVSNCERHGIIYSGSGSGDIAANLIRENGEVGISVQLFGSPMIRENTIVRNRGVGIAFVEKSKGEAVDNVIRENGEVGIQVEAEASPVLRHNTVEGNTKVGIGYIGKASGEAVDNMVKINGEVGIQLQAEVYPTIRSNIVEGNKEVGIAYIQKAMGEAVENLIIGNGKSGIWVEAQAAPRLIGNTVVKNAYSGIGIVDGARPLVLGNVIHANTWGVGVVIDGRERGQPNLEGNLFNGNRGHDVMGLAQGPTDVVRTIQFINEPGSYILAHPDGSHDPSYGWSGLIGKRPLETPTLVGSVTVEENSRDRSISSEATVALRMVVRNAGKGPSKRLRAQISILSDSPGLLVPQSVAIGDLSPRTDWLGTIPIRAIQKVGSASASVGIKLVDAFGFSAPEMRISFETVALGYPHRDSKPK